jgi:hypothetical protein
VRRSQFSKMPVQGWSAPRDCTRRDDFPRGIRALRAREYDVAKAKYQEGSEHRSLVDDQAREEERSFAEAQLAQAQLQDKRAL